MYVESCSADSAAGTSKLECEAVTGRQPLHCVGDPVCTFSSAYDQDAYTWILDVNLGTLYGNGLNFGVNQRGPCHVRRGVSAW